MTGPQPSPELRARVLAAVQGQKVAPRAAGARRRALVFAAGLAAWAMMVIVIGRPALRGRPLSYALFLGALWLLSALAATWAGVSRGGSMLGRTAGSKIAVAVLTPGVLIASASLSGVAWSPAASSDATGAATTLVCLLGALLFSLGPLIAFLALWRAGDAVAPHSTGAAIGAAAGAWGALGIALHCGHTSAGHVLAGHVLPVALLALIGAVLGHRVLAVRGTLSGQIGSRSAS